MTEANALHHLSASDAARLIAEGTITSEALVASWLEHIETREPAVQAWAYLDPDLALAQARACDRTEPQGRCTAYPWGPRISSKRATCRPSMDRRYSPVTGLATMPSV